MGIGRTLIYLGAALVVIGVILTVGDRLPLKLGRLPGDLQFRGKHGVFYFPLVTSILLSVVFSLVMWLFGRR